MKQLYIIEYDNAHWCGGRLECVAWAESPDEAVDAAGEYMEASQRELFDDHYNPPDWDGEDGDEPGEYDNEQAFTVISVKPLEGSEYEEYYLDPVQRNNFYPCVNDHEAEPTSKFYKL